MAAACACRNDSAHRSHDGSWPLAAGYVTAAAGVPPDTSNAALGASIITGIVARGSFPLSRYSALPYVTRRVCCTVVEAIATLEVGHPGLKLSSCRVVQQAG